MHDEACRSLFETAEDVITENALFHNIADGGCCYALWSACSLARRPSLHKHKAPESRVASAADGGRSAFNEAATASTQGGVETGTRKSLRSSSGPMRAETCKSGGAHRLQAMDNGQL